MNEKQTNADLISAIVHQIDALKDELRYFRDSNGLVYTWYDEGHEEINHSYGITRFVSERLEFYAQELEKDIQAEIERLYGEIDRIGGEK